MKLLFFDDFKLGVLKATRGRRVGHGEDIPHRADNLISGLIERWADYKTPGSGGRARRGKPVGR